MGSNIVSISIYSNNTRVKLTPDSEGKFLIPNHARSTTSKPLVKVTAMELISHPKLKYMDPVLTLDDGTKLRVFQAGDPTGLLVTAASLVDKHDDKHREKTKKVPVSSKRGKSLSILDIPIGNSYVDTCDYDYDYPWDDPSLYDDAD